MSEKQMKILGWVATFMLLPSTVVSGFTTVFSKKKEISPLLLPMHQVSFLA